VTMDNDGLTQVTQLMTQGVFSLVFLVLYFREQRAHEETRRALYATLREIAGLRHSLYTTNNPVALDST